MNEDERMLMALMGHEQKLQQEEEVSLDDMKRYLCANINRVNGDARKRVGRVVGQSSWSSEIKPTAQGSIMDLGNLPESIIKQMYSTLKYEMSVR